MKNTHICPKCQSNEIMTIKRKGTKGSNHYIFLGAFRRAITPTIYVCGKCGYSESYFEQEGLEKLKETYMKNYH